MDRFRKILLMETLLVFALVMVTLWINVSHLAISWVTRLIAILIVIRSWRRARRTFYADVGLAVSYKDAGQVKFGLLWLVTTLVVLLGIGQLITPGFWRDEQIVDKLNSFGIFYFGSVIGQELLMQGYFANRMYVAFPGRPRLAALLVATLFAIAHCPNWLLAAGTFVFAFGSSYFFLMRSRNLYLMIFAQLLLSPLYKALVMYPLVGHGCMRVGEFFLKR